MRHWWVKAPVGYLMRSETSQRVSPLSKTANGLGVLCCTETCVTLSPKPFINADILSPQIQSQIVKFVPYIPAKAKHTQAGEKKRKKQDILPPPRFAANAKTFLCHLPLLELSQSLRALTKAAALCVIKRGGFPPPFGLSASQSSRHTRLQ